MNRPLATRADYARVITLELSEFRWGGRVEAVIFPQAHSDSFGSGYSACEPLVDEALKHLPHTTLAARYDTFDLIGAAK